MPNGFSASNQGTAATMPPAHPHTCTPRHALQPRLPARAPALPYLSNRAYYRYSICYPAQKKCLEAALKFLPMLEVGLAAAQAKRAPVPDFGDAEEETEDPPPPVF